MNGRWIIFKKSTTAKIHFSEECEGRVPLVPTINNHNRCCCIITTLAVRMLAPRIATDVMINLVAPLRIVRRATWLYKLGQNAHRCVNTACLLSIQTIKFSVPNLLQILVKARCCVVDAVDFQRVQLVTTRSSVRTAR